MKSKWKLSDSDINFITLIGDPTTKFQKKTYSLTETQAKAILELRLHRLRRSKNKVEKKDKSRESETITILVLNLCIVNSQD